MLFFDSHDLLMELRHIKGELVTRQTKRLSISQKASHVSSNVVESSNGTKLNTLQVGIPTMSSVVPILKIKRSECYGKSISTQNYRCWGLGFGCFKRPGSKVHVLIIWTREEPRVLLKNNKNVLPFCNIKPSGKQTTNQKILQNITLHLVTLSLSTHV